MLRSDSPAPGTVIARVHGHVNLDNAPTLRRELYRLADLPNLQRLLVDLSDVPYMDSSGIATLIELLSHLKTKGTPLVLFGLQPRVRGMMEITRLLKIFTIRDDEVAALGA